MTRNTAVCWSLRRVVLMTTAALVTICSLQAQVESGKVVGTVRDASGAVVADAAVGLVNTATNLSRSVRTESNGEYVITGLNPGEYTVTVEHEGFKKAMQAAFKLDVNQVIRVDMTLVVGSIHEQVEVTAAEPLIESETSSLGQVVEEQRVKELPLNGRNFVELAYLSPGVNAGPSGAVQQGGIPENQRGTGSIQANGLTATNNNFLLNGFDNNEQQIGIQVIQPAIDAIQEFKVQTNNFGADIGRGGAVVNVLLKSGSNQFHGSVYEFLRNSAFDAKNYFDDPASPIVRWNLQFRAEAFNLFNTPEFGLPYNGVNDIGLAGSISSTVHSSRQIQLALKLAF
jgi:carboxypeptidase family protein